MNQSEKQIVNVPVGWFLTRKIHTIESAFDELAVLEAKVKEPGKSSSRERRELIDALSEYQFGLPTNTLAQCKADIWNADTLVCLSLRDLYRAENFDLQEVDRLEKLLGHALESLLKVYATEETRIRAYTRKGEPQPQKSKRPKPAESETEKAPNEA